MGKYRRNRRGPDDNTNAVLAAFGAGLFLAVFCSFRLALLVAAIALIYISCRSRPC